MYIKSCLNTKRTDNQIEEFPNNYGFKRIFPWAAIVKTLKSRWDTFKESTSSGSFFGRKPKKRGMQVKGLGNSTVFFLNEYK